MSGHSKWSQIKHKKALSDARKSKEFAKLAKQITLAARELGPNIEINSRLKSAVEKARSFNMPSENIERAIKRATSKEEGALEEVLFEAYGPGGSAFIIEGITDNKNRTTQEIKHLLSEYGIKLAAPGSAKFLFTKTDEGWRPKTALEIDEVAEEQLKKLFEALDERDDINDIYTNASLEG